MRDMDEEDEKLIGEGTARKGGNQRWTWSLAGLVFGVVVTIISQVGSEIVPHLKAAIGSGGTAATTCGVVPLGLPFTKRRQDGKVKNVLVTGGAGFIASHFALMLLDKTGFNVTMVDDLSRGSIDTVLRLQTIAEAKGQPLNFENADVGNQNHMETLMRRNSIELVVHFSGNAYVGESMVRPEDYYQNITASTIALVRAMQRAGVNRLIFSSSCATFGAPTTFPITEESPQRPTNPYGQAKLQAEQAIIAFLEAQKRQGAPFSAALLRYFNVIGADPEGRLGPHLRHEANARFPRIVDAAYDVALGKRTHLGVMGSTFPTKDGSAQRDYIHVSDLVAAHVQLMFALHSNELLFYNVGNGKPYTVLEIVEVVKAVSGKPIPVKMAANRPGDPAILYTDPKKIMFELGWSPKYPDIESMVRHGWDWRTKHYGTTPAPSVDPLMHSYPAFLPGVNDTAPPLGDNPRIVIIGAGPTGLCAAYHLTELGYQNWELVEASDKPAGLACTIKDEKGFFWDIGVHCLFSHFEFFDALLDDMLPPKDWLYHQRYSPARMRDTWIGYPVQSNLWRLPEKEVVGIVADLAQMDAVKHVPKPAPRNFKEWLHLGFGKALTESFMAPYNAKVWAHPANEMNSIWVGERVAVIKFGDVLSNIINKRDAPAWGPNAQFRYPMRGTGTIWVKIYEALPAQNKRLSSRVTAIRTKGKKHLQLAGGATVPFDGLLSTIPVVQLLRMTPDHPELAELAEGNNGAVDHSKFKHQTVNLVGVGIEGTQLPDSLNGVHWVYFPEDEYIFYRVTVLSNFSPLMVAKPYKQWSLLIEVSESKYRVVPKSREELRKRVLDGLYRSGMLQRNQSIASVWDTRLEYGYPVPYVERNMHMHAADKALRDLGVWSRGRFGSWKYEVANQDHSCMLGVDAVDSMLFGGTEIDAGKGVHFYREKTFNAPNKVNVEYRKYNRMFDPKAMAKKAGRAHTFAAPPRRMRTLNQWDWVTFHCQADDGWLVKVREVMTAQAGFGTKWLLHGYEHCGHGDKKRPMMAMLSEGLNHHDRIPNGQSIGISGWVKHVVRSLQGKVGLGHLPQRMFFVPETLPASSSLFRAAGSPGAIDASKDFVMWGAEVEELPEGLNEEFCKNWWPVITGHRPKRERKRCPNHISSMSQGAIAVNTNRLKAAPLSTWQQVLSLLDASLPEQAERVQQLLYFSFHILLGEPHILPKTSMNLHSGAEIGFVRGAERA